MLIIAKNYAKIQTTEIWSGWKAPGRTITVNLGLPLGSPNRKIGGIPPWGICERRLTMHEHTHDHAHTHTHAHGEGKPMSPEEVLALMTYMLDHNRHHADELHEICHALEDQGKAEAAAALADALHYFDHCNDKLEEALKLTKGE